MRNFSIYKLHIYKKPIYREPIYKSSIYREPIYKLLIYKSSIYRQDIYRQPIYIKPVYIQHIYSSYIQPTYIQTRYIQVTYIQPAYIQISTYKSLIYKKVIYIQAVYTFMGFKTIVVRDEVHEKLKKISKEKGVSISKVLEGLIEGKDFSKSVEVPKEVLELKEEIRSLRELLMKHVSEMADLKGKVSAVHEILMKATKKKQDKVETKEEVKPKPEAKPKGLKEEIREAFLGKRGPVTLADGKIVVSKGQIFVKEADIGDYVNLDEYKVNVMDVMAETFAGEEFAEEEEGSVLVPDIGFDEDMSPEDWYDEYGEKLIKELLRVL